MRPLVWPVMVKAQGERLVQRLGPRRGVGGSHDRPERTVKRLCSASAELQQRTTSSGDNTGKLGKRGDICKCIYSQGGREGLEKSVSMFGLQTIVGKCN